MAYPLMAYIEQEGTSSIGLVERCDALSGPMRPPAVFGQRAMIADPKRFAEAIRRIDAANAEDPNVETDAGAARPKELLYCQRMTSALQRLAPDAPEAVQIAV